MEVVDGGTVEPDWALLFGRRADRSSASMHWRRLRGELRERLTESTAHSVVRLVVAYIAYDAAAKMVARTGAVILAPRTKVPSHNPWWTAMRQAGAEARTIERELLLTPRTGGTRAAPAKRSATPSDRYLRAV